MPANAPRHANDALSSGEVGNRVAAAGQRPPVAADDALARTLARSVGRRAEQPAGSTGAVLQRVKRTIVQHGEMSGDQFAAAVALLLDKELCLYLVGGTAGHVSVRDKTQQIYDFYVHLTGVEAKRVHLELHDDPPKRVREILWGMKDAHWKQETASIGDATNRVRHVFSQDPKAAAKAVREAWRMSSATKDEEFDRLVQYWRIPLDRPVAVLWSRKSGALGGLHPDLDSDYEGIAQLAEGFHDEGYAVLVVGDDPKRKIITRNADLELRKMHERNAPESEIRQRRSELGERPQWEKQAIWMGQFWEHGMVGKPRTAQFAFFEHLRQLVPTLTHVGMRSGNLEAYAYMGHRVLFIEEIERTDAPRMGKLAGMNVGLKYRAVRITDLPTRAGRALMENPAPSLLHGGMKHDRTGDPRFRWRNQVENAFEQLNVDAKRRGHKREELSKERLALLKKYARLPEKLKSSPPHQQPLKRYEWLKRRAPELVADDRSGFTPSDRDAVVSAAMTRVWCVTVPEPELETLFDAKLVAMGGLRPDRSYQGLDGERYYLVSVAPVLERISIKGRTPYIRSTPHFEFVRLPSTLSDEPVDLETMPPGRAPQPYRIVY